jgi:hypothetical protein
MEQIVIPPKKVGLTSEKFIYKLALNRENSRIVPFSYDIIGIDIDFPKELNEVRIRIGGSSIITFDSNSKSQLASFPIYLTLSRNMYTFIEFVYDKEWLEKQQEYQFEDEYTEKIEYKEDVEIFDGESYYIGSRVVRKYTPTGNKIRTISKDVDVIIPKFILKVEEKTEINYNICVEVPIRQKIDLI